MDIKSAFVFLEQLGIFDVILPFIFIFTVFFAVLERIHILGKTGNPRVYHAVISLIVAFIFIFSKERVLILNLILIKITLLLVASIMLFFLMGTAIDKPGFKSHWWIGVIMGILMLIFGTTLNWFKYSDLLVLLKFFINPFFIGILFFVGVIWWITRDGKKGGSSGSSSSRSSNSSGSSSSGSSGSSGNPKPNAPGPGRQIGSYAPKEGSEWKE